MLDSIGCVVVSNGNRIETCVTGCRDPLDRTLLIIGCVVFEIVGRWRVCMKINTPPAGTGPTPGGSAHLDCWMRPSLHPTPYPPIAIPAQCGKLRSMGNCRVPSLGKDTMAGTGWIPESVTIAPSRTEATLCHCPHSLAPPPTPAPRGKSTPTGVCTLGHTWPQPGP